MKALKILLSIMLLLGVFGYTNAQMQCIEKVTINGDSLYLGLNEIWAVLDNPAENKAVIIVDYRFEGYDVDQTYNEIKSLLVPTNSFVAINDSEQNNREMIISKGHIRTITETPSGVTILMKPANARDWMERIEATQSFSSLSGSLLGCTIGGGGGGDVVTAVSFDGNDLDVTTDFGTFNATIDGSTIVTTQQIGIYAAGTALEDILTDLVTDLHDPAYISGTSNTALTIDFGLQELDLNLKAAGSFDNAGTSIPVTNINGAIAWLEQNLPTGATNGLSLIGSDVGLGGDMDAGLTTIEGDSTSTALVWTDMFGYTIQGKNFNVESTQNAEIEADVFAELASPGRVLINTPDALGATAVVNSLLQLETSSSNEYTPYGFPQTIGSNGDILVFDGVDQWGYQALSASLGLTSDNGITLSTPTNIQLGGTLVKSTIVDGVDTYGFTVKDVTAFLANSSDAEVDIGVNKAELLNFTTGAGVEFTGTRSRIGSGSLALEVKTQNVASADNYSILQLQNNSTGEVEYTPYQLPTAAPSGTGAYAISFGGGGTATWVATDADVSGFMTAFTITDGSTDQLVANSDSIITFNSLSTNVLTSSITATNNVNYKVDASGATEGQVITNVGGVADWADAAGGGWKISDGATVDSVDTWEQVTFNDGTGITTTRTGDRVIAFDWAADLADLDDISAATTANTSLTWNGSSYVWVDTRFACDSLGNCSITDLSDVTSTDVNNWNEAYDNYPTNLSFAGSTTKTLTMSLRDGSTLQANFTDLLAGAGDDWGSQVVVSDATLNGTGVTGDPLSVNVTGLDTDEQELQLNTTLLSITNGNTVDLASIDTDDQTVDTFEFDIPTSVLTLAVGDDGQSPHTVDLSSLDDSGVDENTTVTDQANGLDIGEIGDDITIAFDMMELTSEATPDAADSLWLWDASANTNDRVAVGDLPSSEGTTVTDQANVLDIGLIGDDITIAFDPSEVAQQPADLADLVVYEDVTDGGIHHMTFTQLQTLVDTDTDATTVSDSANGLDIGEISDDITISLDMMELTSEATPDVADSLWIWDSSANNNDRVAIGDLPSSEATTVSDGDAIDLTLTTFDITADLDPSAVGNQAGDLADLIPYEDVTDGGIHHMTFTQLQTLVDTDTDATTVSDSANGLDIGEIADDITINLDMMELTSEATPDVADSLWIWDSSANSNDRVAIGDLPGIADGNGMFDAGNDSGTWLVDDWTTATGVSVMTLGNDIEVDLGASDRLWEFEFDENFAQTSWMAFREGTDDDYHLNIDYGTDSGVRIMGGGTFSLSVREESNDLDPTLVMQMMRGVMSDSTMTVGSSTTTTNRLDIRAKFVTIDDIPEYANDGAADSDSDLPQYGLYFVTGDRSIRIKP